MVLVFWFFVLLYSQTSLVFIKTQGIKTEGPMEDLEEDLRDVVPGSFTDPIILRSSHSSRRQRHRLKLFRGLTVTTQGLLSLVLRHLRYLRIETEGTVRDRGVCSVTL